MTGDVVQAVFDMCSNRGRWGADDELGTLNYITAAKRIAAAKLIRQGLTIGLGLELGDELGPAVRRLVTRTAADVSAAPLLVAEDRIEIAPHGFVVTHLDAVGHVGNGPVSYNGRQSGETMSTDGLLRGSIAAAHNGVVTRGVLLDVAAARGVGWLEPEDVVEPEDLEAAEKLAKVHVESGDAIFVRIGLGARVAVSGPEDTSRRAGIGLRCMPWLHERQVAVYSGDCVDVAPSPYEDFPLPFHQIALASMGLLLLDCPDVEVLRQTAAQVGSSEFLLVIAPLWIQRGTGSPVNPVAVF